MPADARFMPFAHALERLFVWTQSKVESLAQQTRLCEHAGTTRLDGLDLCFTPSSSAEAGGEVTAVKELAGLRLNRAERLSRESTDETTVLAGESTAR